MEAAGGLVLMAVTVVAMAVANSPLASHYEAIFLAHGPASLFINDGLMVIFFLLVGLEIKHETKAGELASLQNALLPIMAAIGGVVVPACIYLAFTHGTESSNGWAIPAATDIAFSLGVLSLFGKRVPASLKIFLMALAVIDDLIAVMVIALFYTAQLSLVALLVAVLAVALLMVMNRKNVMQLRWYVVVGAVLYGAVLLSGVHATIAGVVLGLVIPHALGRALIHKLHGWVAFAIVPIFAFANAGIPLAGITFESFHQPITLGIAFGLFFGKQLGIFLVCWLMILLGFAKMPSGARFSQLYGVSLLAGIGFTMSLFISALALNDAQLLQYSKLGVMSGSLLSALIGAMVLKVATHNTTKPL